MIKKWEDIKVGDVMKDGSIVTQIHRVHDEVCVEVTYDTDKKFVCAYTHVLLVDVSKLPAEGKRELEQFCTFVPLEEDYSVSSDKPLTDNEALIVDQFLHNEPINTIVDCIQDNDETEIYDFYFDEVKRIEIKNIITKSEPQKVDENTYWLTCKGIDYLMQKYHVDLYCNGNLINKIEHIGKQPCFCISTNTGRYET